MPDGDAHQDATLFPKRPGEQLRDARIAQGLELADIAARTRIPQRHLDAIESGNYAALPSTTYALGFSRSYARAVGVNEVALANAVRGELAVVPERSVVIPAYEIDDPARTPSRGLAITGLAVALLALVAVGLWYGTNLFQGGETSTTAPVTVAAPGPAAVVPTPTAPPPPTGGQVTLTATDEVWVRVYDASDTTLLMKTMAPGERYDVPATADNPMINVGRPDKIALTVNGSRVPPLGDGRVAILDVPIGAEALLARTAPPAPAGNASAAP